MILSIDAVPTPLPPELSSCDREPIRVPGAVQPHGRLLVLDPVLLTPVAFSDNWTPESMQAARSTIASLDLPELQPGSPSVSLGAWPLEEKAWDVSAHRSERHLFFEFEAAQPSNGNEAPIYSLSRIFLPRLQDASSVARLTELAAHEMKRLTGFGRCLIYRFDARGHGEVLAEAIDDGYDSYAGHHFPASDIPQQARALYLANRFRLIADANYTPVPLRIVDAALSREDIDLSQAQLRSVSPVHLEYMRNMGTLASMSVSIVIDGKLWGLVSCHDHAPRFIGTATRLACEHLGQLLALQIQSTEANDLVAEKLALRQLSMRVVARLADSDATLRGLMDDPELMLQLGRATGAALVLDETVWTAGAVPDLQAIRALADWVDAQGTPVFSTPALAERYAPAAAFLPEGAGVLAVSISQVHRHVILWFRPEIVRTVTWAGNPSKPAATDGQRIHPRLSFESWQENVRGSAVAWTDAEIGAAADLRQALIGIVLRRAEELAVVALELGRVNKELEAFSYTVSHDLRAPMRHIAGYVDLVVESEKQHMSARALRYLTNVKEAASFAGQLVDALLDFSRMGRASLKRRPVDTGLMVKDLVRELSRQEPDRRVEWHHAPAYPTLHADALLLQVVMRNLLSNALKYSRGREPAHITIRAVHNARGEGLEVEDNGVGFQMQYMEKLFGVFQRLHGTDDFEGTGIGLANVKRIVERHGGTVWAAGEPGEGARFGFVLPRAPVDGDPETVPPVTHVL